MGYLQQNARCEKKSGTKTSSKAEQLKIPGKGMVWSSLQQWIGHRLSMHVWNARQLHYWLLLRRLRWISWLWLLNVMIIEYWMMITGYIHSICMCTCTCTHMHAYVWMCIHMTCIYSSCMTTLHVCILYHTLLMYMWYMYTKIFFFRRPR